MATRRRSRPSAPPAPGSFEAQERATKEWLSHGLHAAIRRDPDHARKVRAWIRSEDRKRKEGVNF
jgi:hypothetical protein